MVYFPAVCSGGLENPGLIPNCRALRARRSQKVTLPDATGVTITVRSSANKFRVDKKPITQGVRHYAVSHDEAGQRLDNALLRLLKGVPKTHVYRLLRTGQVRVNGGRRGPGYRLRDGDLLRLPPVRQAERIPQDGPLARVKPVLEAGILYEDADLLVIDKPTGIPVHGGSGLAGGLIEALRRLREEPRLELAHRIDRDTSGCLIIARRRSSLRALHAAFREGRVRKRYLALLLGEIHAPFESRAPLRRYVQRGGERHVAVAADGRPARTRFLPKVTSGALSLVEIELGTGRTHQIRVHATHAGYPVAGDPRYGDEVQNRRLRALGLRRLALHAARLQLEHPRTGQALDLHAPLPADLLEVLERLEMDRSEIPTYGSSLRTL